MKKVALIGCGSLGTIIAQGILENLGEDYTLAAVMDNRPQVAMDLAHECGCKGCTELSELLAENPAYVVEAAGPEVLREIALPVLRAGADLLPLSVGIFADDIFYLTVKDTAAKLGRRVYIVSGAIGGFDVMQAAMMGGSVTASIANLKAPSALNGAPGLGGKLLPVDREVVVFSGTARQAIEKFPKNVNVAVALALNTIGVDETRTEIRSMPGMENNLHRIIVTGEFGEATIEVASRPSRHNPKSSSMAAYSVLAKLKNLAQPISFC